MLNISVAEGAGRTGRRDLVIALSGRMVSAFGDTVALIALTLRLQAGGAGPYVVALLFGAGTAPLLLLAGAVGHLVDSHDSRRLLVGAGLLAVACTAPLVVVHSVVVILALLAVATSVASSAWSALVPRMVGEDGVAAAVSAQQSLNALVAVGAPAVGGLLAGAFGSGVPLALDAGTFVVVTMAAALVRTRRGPGEPDPDAPSAAPRGGFHLLRADPVLAPLTVGLGLVVLLVGMVDVVLVYLVRETLHAGGVWYGVAEASWMAGIVGGSLGAGRLGTEPRQTWVTIGGAGLACAALAPFALVPAVWMLVPLSIVGGIGNGLAIACFSTLLIRRTPDAERGRVSAAAGATIGSAQGLSLLAGGGLATVLRPRAVYGTAGLLGLAGAAATATSLALGRRKGQAEKTVC